MPEPFDNLVVDIIAGLIVAAILAALAWLWRRGKPPTVAPQAPTPPGQDSLTFRAGDRTVTLKDVHVGGDLNIYVDGLPQATPKVRDPFEEGRRLQQTEQHDAAIRQFEKAFVAAENDRQRCALHILVGNSLLRGGRLAEAEGRYREALDAARRAKDREGESNALGNLGLVYYHRGELDKAEEHHKKALAIDEEIGNRLGQAQDLGNLGIVYDDRGELDKAEEHHKKALAIHQEMGNRRGQANDLGNLGIVYARRGDLARAEEHYEKALAIHEEIGNRLGQANQLRNLGVLQAQRGNAPDALRYLHDARRIFAEAGASADVDKTDRLIERLEGASPPKPRQNRGSEKRPPKP